MPATTPEFPDIAVIDSHTKLILSENRVKFSFSSNDSSLSAIFIRPRDSAELDAWSFIDEVPETFNKTYFVSIANGVETDPFNFDVTLKTDGNHDVPLLDLTLISMKFDREKSYTLDFKRILNRVPDWAFAQHCIGAVTSYVY